jgi:hypothetical protein
VSKPVNHVATLRPCETCHKNTTTFLSWTMDHSGITSGCSACHQGQVPNTVSMPPAPINHVPVQAGQECDSCHTPANTSNYMTFQGVTTYDHAGITGNCASCHGATGQIFGVKKVNTVPPEHISIDAGQDCGACHMQTTPGGFLMFQYTHSPTLTTSGSCDSCHSGTYPLVTFKPTTHIPTTAKCDVCHDVINTVGYTSFKGAQYHKYVTATAGTCSGCHTGSFSLPSGNGAIAQGTGSASGGHIPVSGSCDLCHTASNTSFYTSFQVQGTSYHANQTATPGVCAICHNGKINTLSVTGVPPYGMNSGHIATSAECDTCHTQALTLNYTTFLGATFNHAAVTPAVTGRCSACHGSAVSPPIAKQKSSSHVPTAAECDTCHTQTISANYTTFGGVGYHATNAVAAGSCGKATCHDGSSATAFGKPTSHLTTAAVCDSCHTSSTTANFTTWKNAKYHVNVTVAAGSCGNAGCHDGSANGIAMGAKGKSSSHVSTVAACDTCHINTTNYTTWLGAIYTHTAAANGICQNCHNGTAASGQLSPHIPATGTCDAGGCHATAINNVAAGYPAGWLGATYAPHPASVANTCRTCHTGTYPGVSTQTWSPGGLAGLNGLPHMNTAAQCDSSGCHTLSVSFYTSATPTWAGAGYAHSAADAGQCTKAGCHGAGGAGKGVSTNHIPVSVSCDNGGCHKVFSATTTTFAGGIWNHTVTSSQRCDSCHGKYPGFGVYGATGSNVVNHIPIGSGSMSGVNDCNFCHTSAAPSARPASNLAGWSTSTVGVLQHNGIPGGAPNYCVNCHYSTSPYYAPKITKMSHRGASVSTDCSSSKCHRPLGGTGTSWSKWN